MDLLQRVKTSLRITHDALDNEIFDLIAACKVDLAVSGLKDINEANPLLVFCVTAYCKAHFGFDNQDAERLQKTYQAAKQHLVFGEMGGIYGTI